MSTCTLLEVDSEKYFFCGSVEKLFEVGVNIIDCIIVNL